MNVVYVYADGPREWNCSEWRCAVPARALSRARPHAAQLLNIQDFAYNTPAARAACEPADVIVVQRNLFGPVLTAIQHWKARDKVVIADFDDAYDLIPPSNPSYRFWAQGFGQREDGQPVKIDPPPLTQFKWGLRLVHGATVASQRLAGDWQDYADVYYVPNYIDLEKYRDVRPEPHEGVWIGWGGSLTHVQSFAGSGVLTALKRVCQARPQVKVLIHGNDQRIIDQLPLPPAQKALRPWVPYEAWPQQLAGFDIGLAPLHGAYDERRSWIKILEYLVLRIPWIASDGPAYADLRSYGWLVKNTPSAWERVLLDMIDHLDDYKAEASREPYLFGLSQAVDANVDKIVATYSEIAARVFQPTAGRAAPAIPAGLELRC
jgi:glycosyltransferase involved in cell wall biosynthesis